MMIDVRVSHMGLLTLRHERLKLFLATCAAHAPRLGLDEVRRWTRGITIDPGEDGPMVGFALLSAKSGTAWRFAGYVWRIDGLARLVLWIDPLGGQPGRMPDAAFHIGGMAEVALIAAEWARWQRAAAQADGLDRYLADVAQ